MLSKYLLYLLSILLIIITGSCKRDDKSRTTVQTTDFEIPSEPPATPQQPSPSMNIPNDQVFREACLEGKIEQVEQFIQNGMDVQSIDQDGRSGLMLACFNGHIEIVRKLLEEGSKINRTDNMGRTALMYASTGHYPKTVELLLSKGADPNLVDNDEGFTALMFAGAEGNIKVVSLLLEHGADPSLKDKDGDTAESFARKNGHTEVADLIKSIRL